MCPLLVLRFKDFTIDGKVEDEPVDQNEYNDLYKSKDGDAFKDAYRDILLYATGECNNCAEGEL